MNFCTSVTSRLALVIYLGRCWATVVGELPYIRMLSKSFSIALVIISLANCWIWLLNLFTS